MEKNADGIHIGVIDSLGKPIGYLSSKHEFINIFDDYLGENSPDATGHGTTVTDLISSTATKASFSLFRVIGSNPKQGGRKTLINAIGDAGATDVDVLNLSIGLSRSCNGFCSICREARDVAMEENVSIVVATGNAGRTKGQGVACPAIPEPVIGVGGYIPSCGEDIIRNANSRQWWVKNGVTFGPYCGRMGCCESKNCSDCSDETEWPGNVKFHNSAPDVLAPVVEVHGSSLDTITRQSGTSFAAPLVTGLIANIFGETSNDKSRPSAEEMYDAASRGVS